MKRLFPFLLLVVCVVAFFVADDVVSAFDRLIDRDRSVEITYGSDGEHETFTRSVTRTRTYQDCDCSTYERSRTWARTFVERDACDSCDTAETEACDASAGDGDCAGAHRHRGRRHRWILR